MSPQTAADITALAATQSLLAGRYKVERELGAGAMATVYLAEEMKHGRPVAIKVLRPELAQTLGADRFLREIGIAARLSHPHLVPLIDSGEVGGLLYYVSAYVAGGSLRDLLRKEERLSVARAHRIAQEVGAALDYAHRAGVVHRDVKPENILFADGHALLADFGIARAPKRDEEDLVTGAGIAVGTPEYMSPEQASGERELDARSDIYSLACVVFEMLTGDAPFHGPTVRATMAKHVTETARRVRQLRPEIPPAVDDAIARALAKDPAQRFAAVHDFIVAMHHPDTARGHFSAGVTRSIAVLPFVNASAEPGNEYLSDGITDELIDALAKVEGLRVASRTSVFAIKNKSLDVRAIGALLDCAVVLEGTVRRAGQQLRITAQLTSTDDGHLLWSQRYDRELHDVFAIQDEIARTIVTTLRATTFADLAPPPTTRHTENLKAYAHYLRGRFELNRRTQDGISAGIHYFEQAIAEDPQYALAYAGLSDAHALRVDYRSVPVAQGLEHAMHYARQALLIDDKLAEPHASLAWALFIYHWRWDEAEHEFRRAIELDPRYHIAHQWFAFLLAARGQREEALVEGHTAVELDPGSLFARRSLAWIYLYARRYDRARAQLERALTMNPNAEETYRTLGLVLTHAGEHDEAIRALDEAVAMREAGSYTRATLGHALARAGRTDDARRILEELAAQATRDYVSPVAMATVLLGLGDVERALDWTERAYEDRRGWLAYVKVNPMMDPMREHPRFKVLVEKMAL